ncbi:dTDP-4-amino-4,6-dideoxyglucose formyltransferase [uncultured Tenacibaculum sp.]|uniref:dTDP-4-amino-4,6-dideoxyglucose formyltransferase n=1 Tax=uncultured Tenacibaculum sp. TaxID=174713 RepID=UPI002606CC85|nr:dTDP-4-amino-4,6-dideoxyglucose formyltransferase [uncultured Tenacibaculum sp.]
MNRYKRILIITDNREITEKFIKEVLPVVEEDVEFEFACSPTSDINVIEDFYFRNINLKNDQIVEELIAAKDLIISLHCKQLFPVKLISNIKCINVHPGYNPINRGWFPQVFAIVNNIDIGATIHEIDEKLDNGNIISRSKVEKYCYDTSSSLYERVINEELRLLKESINSIVNNNYKAFKPEGSGNLYLKRDFQELCKLNLDEKCTMGEAINKLRALTHGDYKNAYYFDKAGNKIFVSLNIELKKE